MPRWREVGLGFYPPEGERVNVLWVNDLDRREKDMAWWSGGQWSSRTGSVPNNRVTHWSPLEADPEDDHTKREGLTVKIPVQARWTSIIVVADLDGSVRVYADGEKLEGVARVWDRPLDPVQVYEANRGQPDPTVIGKARRV